MFGLLDLLLFLVSTAVATYGDTASIAAKINLRQLQLYNSGSYETLVDELYFPDATIYVDGFGFVARGHDQILAIIKRNAGYMNSVNIQINDVADDETAFFANVTMSFTTYYGKQFSYTVEQAILDEQIIHVQVHPTKV